MRKKFRLSSIKCAVLFFLVLLFLIHGNAYATSIANIQGWVDWSTFVVTVGGSTPNYVDRGSYSQANAGYSDSMGSPAEQWSPRDPNFWGTSEAMKTVGNATGHTWATENEIHTDARALADGIANTYGRASSWVYRIGYFTLEEDSTISISVTFDLQKYFEYNTSFETAGGYNYFGIGLYRKNPDTGIDEAVTAGPNRQYWYNSNIENLNGFWSSEETLGFSYPLTGGFTYAVDVAINSDANCGTRAVAPVPEPATMLLIGSGLIGLAGLRKKFKK